MMHRRRTWIALALGAGAIVFAQQAAYQARTASDPGLGAAYSWKPGGTAEADLWQVLLLFGVQDQEATTWDGKVEAAGAEVHAIEPYRFDLDDRTLPQGGWQIQTKTERVLISNDHTTGGRVKDERPLPKGVLVRGAGTATARLTVTTPRGVCTVSPASIEFGVPGQCLDGAMEIHRLPPATDLAGTAERQHDFPSLGGADSGPLWAAWMSYHDRNEELNLRRYENSEWTRLIPVPRAQADLWRPAVATDDEGRPWLIWSQQKDGNWDIFAMPWEDNRWGRLHKLSDSPLPDIEPSVARGPDGTIFVVWQTQQEQASQIRLRYLKGGAWAEPVAITASEFNDWEPAVAVGADGTVWVVWDRYAGNYDVHARSFSVSTGLGPEMAVAATPRFEGHASIAVDHINRPWVAWESGGVNWGKDLGEVLGTDSPGSPLGEERQIEVAAWDGSSWKSPAEFAPQDSLEPGSVSYNGPLLFVDPNGQVWMSFKRQYSRRAYRSSTYWESYLTRLTADGWMDPIPLPHSWTRKSTRLSLAAAGGRLWAFWPSESRAYAFASRPLASRVIAGSLPLPGAASSGARLTSRAAAPVEVPVVHPNEAQDVARIRTHRVRVGGQDVQIVRGDLHRHTELSQDNGGLSDGSLPEFYRYMIDAAAMDFGASTDHQGGGTDYWNFMTQKMADMYLVPGRFVPLYAYERNVAAPMGHRNLIFTHRNYRVVPFFQRIHPQFTLPDSPDGELLTLNSVKFGGVIENDTELLHEDVRESGGLSIPHTSGNAAMGTDWGAPDSDIEPAVEIYQGARRNYEHLGAPRGVTSGERGTLDAGMIWNAWKKGYRLGVIASSDHFSTHISYAMVYTPASTREAIFEAIRARRVYGATDNIILEFWLGDHFMGEDFRASERRPLRVKVRGTGEVSAIHLIRDANYIHKVNPGTSEVEFEYSDRDAADGEHWYYVRVEQANGELAWSSPIWVNYQ